MDFYTPTIIDVKTGLSWSAGKLLTQGSGKTGMNSIMQ
jgi:hypothetical protein